jgi:hypothetical protein
LTGGLGEYRPGGRSSSIHRSPRAQGSNLVCARRGAGLDTFVAPPNAAPLLVRPDRLPMRGTSGCLTLISLGSCFEFHDLFATA